MFVDFPMHQRPLKHHSKTSALYSRKMPPNSYIDSCESSYYISFHDPSSRSSWTKSQILNILISPGKKNNSSNFLTLKLCWGFTVKSGHVCFAYKPGGILEFCPLTLRFWFRPISWHLLSGQLTIRCYPHARPVKIDKKRRLANLLPSLLL